MSSHITQFRLTILDGVGEGGVTLCYQATLPFIPRPNETFMIADWSVTVGDVAYKFYKDVWYVVLICQYIDRSDTDQKELIKLWRSRGWKQK